MMRLISVAGLLGLLCLFGCQTSWAAGAEKMPTAGSMALGIHQFAVTVKGVERRYLLHVPAIYDPARKWPVVIMFHGGGGSARGALRDTGWDKKADKEGFLALFPEGTSPDMSLPGRFRDNPQTWNDGSKRANVGAVSRGVPDVEFISAMLADLKLRLSVDDRRIFATGFSNGGSMAFRVARELPLTIAAVAPVAGSDWLSDTIPERSVPVLYITGTADPLNPIEGGEIHIGQKAYGTKPATQEMIGKWVKMHGYSDETRIIYDKDEATGMAYGLPGEPPKVVLYTIEEHGHHWPGGKSVLPVGLAGENIAKINATDVIWAFFKSHSLAGNISSAGDSDKRGR